MSKEVVSQAESAGAIKAYLDFFETFLYSPLKRGRNHNSGKLLR